MMPAESALQTSFFPSQQFWDALTVPLPPQMFPGGLQAVPLSQTCFCVSQVISYPLGLLSSGDPPQHAAVASQKSPVIRQPDAMAHAFAPPPRSLQSRVQQFEGPSQGLPPAVQPPGGSMQRPGVAAGVVVAPLSHQPEQQSGP